MSTSQIKVVLTAKSLVKLIEALKESGAYHFKYESLEISFTPTVKGTEIGNGVVDSQALPHLGGDGPTPMSDMSPVPDEEKLMSLMISDPHQYEEVMSQLEANQ